ncbi:RNA 2',3'-cyclic phosphodiesterase [Deinococcus hopiensis]|uniref:RNA 2',3'-cyclic phosphodiesterase n=1 Tax=Deinococcus hopiensis KR-140 TaxID=695939 RepID=A0A1W1VPW7_9DEIO|nr:RNA 2',3'-cyclic phosphodiesterase [Deinococcus hopiensis]SMB95422.1 2'-5' RNA ligase [Deinococcus hopiensis KR-140]
MKIRKTPRPTQQATGQTVERPAVRPQRPGPETPAASPEAREAYTPTLRLFFALKVPSEISAALAEAQKGLRGNWRAVRADQLHITLAFLPGVPPEKVDDLKRLGAALTKGVPPMQVRLRGTGYFPNEGSPRVWFVKVEAEGLTELAAALRVGLAELGIPTDELPFKAHVTLARKKGPAPRLSPLTFDLGWQAGNTVLIRSTLRKTGPIYDTVSTFRFRGAVSDQRSASSEETTTDFPESTPLTQETP